MSRFAPTRVCTSLIALFAVVPFLLVSACSDSALPTAPAAAIMADSVFDMTPELAADARQVIADAVGGAVRYGGEIDEMVRVEAQVPGFGAWYVANGAMEAFLKNPGDSLLVRSVLDREYANRTIPLERQIANTAIHAKIRQGRFSLSELLAIQNKVIGIMRPGSGLSGVGVALFRNRVEIGYLDSTSMATGIQTLKQLGVPRGAFNPEVWGQAVAL
jgi:hypothetical protein